MFALSGAEPRCGEGGVHCRAGFGGPPPYLARVAHDDRRLKTTFTTA